MTKRSNEDIWTERGETFGDKFTERPFWTSFKILVVIGLIGLVVWLVGGFFGFLHSWGDKYAETVGPDNTEEQFTALYGLYENMEATAGNVCSIKGAESSDQGPTFLEDPEFAYEATYRNQQAEYDRRMRNEFEAEWLLLKPDGLPHTAPSLEQMVAQVC